LGKMLEEAWLEEICLWENWCRKSGEVLGYYSWWFEWLFNVNLEIGCF